MSNYPVWWNTAVTVYNKFEDPQTQVVRWYKFVIEGGCFWKYDGGKVVINNTVVQTNGIICRIPKNEKFLEKYLWVQKPNDEMGDYFTLPDL